MSADIGQSLKILLYYLFVSVDIKKSQSILTAWEPLAIHPRVRANRVLIGLGCNLESKTTEIISNFVSFKRATQSLTQQSDSEILKVDFFFAESSLICVPSYVGGSMLVSHKINT